ncbi:sigma-70 family RNA polymerase sigma factor [Streptomyces actuosus]|uniref:Sigma-70 family RNA polymerase sigma factor n=2 Tax=Streptomyces actuosus TaxID=1885 RepID=A0ABS2VVX7_STRAS|nr:sigma-70 family RNA polymerase sigma factor [Streptomyces actuosus]
MGSEDIEDTEELVSAARAGDGQAREQLMADYLPLVYNVVGRALDGHADVDDVVQDTMFRAFDGLDGLREPSRFRSWLVAIAMNQIRRRWKDRQQVSAASTEWLAERPDPKGDFVDLTILRLGLSGQRREVAEATRWLDEDDRALLSLWWQEASGQLTRAELAEALGVSTRHAAVRVQRMKAQLETGRVVVRALSVRPLCRGLASVVGGWDGGPSSVWRKRIARHVRGCRRCEGLASGLIPAEGLLAGLALVVPLSGGSAVPGAQATTSAAGAVSTPVQTPPSGVQSGDGWGSVPGWDASDAPAGGASGAGGPEGAAIGDHARGSAHTGEGGVGWKVYAGGLVAGAVVLAVLWPWAGDSPAQPDGVSPPLAGQVPPFSSAPPRTPTPSVTLPSAQASASPTRSASPSAARSAPSLAQQVADLVNARRAAAGCGPVRLDDRLTAAARAHARDMVARGYFGHESPEGRHADARIAQAGYDAGAWAENLDRGPREASAVVNDWMDGSIHQENMLGCGYRDMGVAAVPGPEGTLWVQTLAEPA